MSEKRKYDPKSVESKWQHFWLSHKIFKTESHSPKPKYYILDMFPYPSGSGLHVGHVEGYTATDIIARYKRMKGFNVLHPMGWDNFGLPAEQYAMRTGTHPSVTTKQNINNFRRQLQAMGYSYDWDREVTTSEPSYYKWTQWIFTMLYQKGLAYEAEVSVNFCPELGTVLANEEVENGKSKEGGYPVVKKPLKQWMLRITAYAERLLEDLALIDWPDSLKQMQVNWIGKSEGAEVSFIENHTKATITVFTTRPDTLFGATYLVLAPEHPLIAMITTKEQSQDVASYQKQTAEENEQDRADATREKTGVFTGAFAVNPVNGKLIPIWIADYVLMGYGTGAIMAVPAHDIRDFEFAKKFQLPIIPVLDPDFNSSAEEIPQNLSFEEARKQVHQGTLCWPGDGTLMSSSNATSKTDIEALHLNDLRKAEAIEKTILWVEKRGAGRRTTSYRLRDWLFARQRYWGEPFPVLHFADGTKRMLELDELPLCAPELMDFRPSGDGQSPLARATDWVSITDSKTGKPAQRETNTMPQWAGSCWYYLRFCDPHNTQEAWDRAIERYWMPVDLYVGGVEHAVLHLLYARFWHKVLFDCGYVSTAEPFQRLRNQGLILARSFQKQGGGYVDPEEVVERKGEFFHKTTNEPLRMQVEKMSKSKLNGISPDAIVEEFGADALRLYEMFMGPLDKDKIWSTDAVSGCRRFLNRFYEMVTSEKVADESNPKNTEDGLKLAHRLVNGVEKDLEDLQFNTAIAKQMEFINAFTKLDQYPKEALKLATLALAPFAPHVAEEAWEILSGEGKLAYTSWPIVDPRYLKEDRVSIIVQMNGKLRGMLDLDLDKSEMEVLEAAQNSPTIGRYLEGKTIIKRIFVPNRLLNLVVETSTPA